MTSQPPKVPDPSTLDRTIHEPTRLAVMGIVCGGYEPDYTFLKNSLGLTDGNLGSHLRTLEAAGYIVADKRFIGRRPNTLYAATPQGIKAYKAYLTALNDFLKAADTG